MNGYFKRNMYKGLRRYRGGYFSLSSRVEKSRIEIWKRNSLRWTWRTDTDFPRIEKNDGRNSICHLERIKKIKGISGRINNLNKRHIGNTHPICPPSGPELLDYRVPGMDFKNVVGQWGCNYVLKDCCQCVQMFWTLLYQ